MPDTFVAKAFTLSLPGREPQHIPAGKHTDLPPEVMEHWFAKAHFAQDGKAVEAPATAPLTHQERESVASTLQAAERRATEAEARAYTAEAAHEALKAEHDTVKADNDSLRQRIASLEADLDKATKPTPAPVTPAAPKPAGK